ncbi:hypothetical protein [Paenibacillus sp. UNC499MF]|uniref:hypothetical protein n=1 Tax=Paenibacillus sp. UNC499MF TaxID=1502751 RepID=UPI0011B09AA9|nr:hypothetical protein [Paenibacillus sp. UNC499MF]
MSKTYAVGGDTGRNPAEPRLWGENAASPPVRVKTDNSMKRVNLPYNPSIVNIFKKICDFCPIFLLLKRGEGPSASKLLTNESLVK